jgi:hypothetical protein
MMEEVLKLACGLYGLGIEATTAVGRAVAFRFPCQKLKASPLLCADTGIGSCEIHSVAKTRMGADVNSHHGHSVLPRWRPPGDVK